MAEHICFNCNKTFKYRSDFERHINKKYKCKVKPLDYDRNSTNCIYCGKKYSNKFSQERHQKTCKSRNDNGPIEVLEHGIIINDTNDIQSDINITQNNNNDTSKTGGVSLDDVLNVNSNVHIEQDNSTENNTTNNNCNNTTTNNNSNNSNISINMPNFIHPFGYEDMTFLTDEEKLKILTSKNGIADAIEAIYSQPQNCNIYRPNVNKQHFSVLMVQEKEVFVNKVLKPKSDPYKFFNLDSDSDTEKKVVLSDGRYIDSDGDIVGPSVKSKFKRKPAQTGAQVEAQPKQNATHQQELDSDNEHLEPRQDESSFESELSSCSGIEESNKKLFIKNHNSGKSKDKQKKYKHRNKGTGKRNDDEDSSDEDKTEISITDILVKSKQLKNMYDLIVDNALKYLDKLLYSCKHKLSFEDQLCIAENINTMRIKMNNNVYLDNIISILETQFRDKLYKEIFNKYEHKIRFNAEFKEDKINAVKLLLKDLNRFIADRTHRTIDDDFLDTQIWSEEVHKSSNANPTNERNNLNNFSIEDTPRYQFFEDMRELEYKYFDEHGISLGNLNLYRKLLIERAQKEIERVEREYNNKKLKDELIGKLINDKKYSFDRRLKQIKFVDTSSLMPGLDTKKFAKLSYNYNNNENIPDCLINY